MGGDSFLSYSTLFGFLFTLARVSGVFAFVPLAGFRAAPEAARIILTVAFTLLLWPQWTTSANVNVTTGRIVVGLAAEMTLGLAIGLALAIALEVFQMAAQMITLQAGLGYASTIDPNSGADSTVLLTIAQLTAGILFFVSGADRLFVKALAESIRLCPPESFTVNKAWGLALVHFAASIFSAGLRLAMPVVALLLLADLSLAVLARLQTQLHLISLTMPIKLAVTMVLLSMTMVVQQSFFNAQMTTWVRLVEGFWQHGH